MSDDELREAEYWGRMKGRHDGGSPEAVVLMREYDRRAGLLLAYDTATSRLEAEVERLAADLARALPVVEAAGALLAFRGDPKLYRDQAWWDREADLLDALAHAYRAAREPRTGEQG